MSWIQLVVTIVGWFFLHKLSTKRDLKNAKRELRTRYLIEVWRKLEFVSYRKKR